MSIRAAFGSIPSLALTIAVIISASQPALALQTKTRFDHFAFPGKVQVVVQPESTALDILFVVDDSGSMQDAQLQLSKNIPSIVSTLVSAKVDIQAAVITSSMDGSWMPSSTLPGEMIGNPAVLKSTSPSFDKDLSKRLLVGTNGSGTETFFDPTEKALSFPLIVGPNAGFLRPHASLAIVVLTNGEDQSTNSDPAKFATFLTNLKGGSKDQVTLLAALIPTSTTAPMCNAGESKPVRLEKAIELLAGEVVSICDANFGSKFTKLGKTLARDITRKIPLPSVPVLDSLVVTYGSTSLTRGDYRKGWSYDVVENAVILGTDFDPMIQPVGTELIVTYKPVDWQ